MKILMLNVKKEYFDAIKSGKKTEEYRLVKPYWTKRLEKTYDKIHILWGYPPKNNMSRRLIFQYMGWTKKTVFCSLFGAKPVEVYAIKLNKRQLLH
ncbi:MAG: ASCH domain-containing protein [bacterium]|nr:ASCH domain-containing protein [bacterium]